MDPMTGLPQPGNGMPPMGGNQGGMPGMGGQPPSPMGPAGGNPMQAIIQMLLQKLMQGGQGGMPGMGTPPAPGPGQSPFGADLPGRGPTTGYDGLPQPKPKAGLGGMAMPNPQGPPPPGWNSWDEFRLDNEKELEQWYRWRDSGHKGDNPLQHFYPAGQTAPTSHGPQGPGGA